MGCIIAHANYIFLVLPNILQGSKRSSKRIANRIYYRPYAINVGGIIKARKDAKKKKAKEILDEY